MGQTRLGCWRRETPLFPTAKTFDRLIADGVMESLTLDYKQSLALSKEDKKRDELCKDVTAFANSAGGQLVFGIQEDKHVPISIDDGAPPEITKEWIEQVIDSRIQPRVEGLIIYLIPLATGLGFVIDIPQDVASASSGSRQALLQAAKLPVCRHGRLRSPRHSASFNHSGFGGAVVVSDWQHLHDGIRRRPRILEDVFPGSHRFEQCSHARSLRDCGRHG